MIVALIDNGSLEPAAHLNLRRVAAALSQRAGLHVCAVSWKHSDKIDPARLDGHAALTIDRWLRAQVAAGERHFVLIPFFISAQGAIGSYLRQDIERVQAALGGVFQFTFTEGLAQRGALAGIVSARVRETIAARQLTRPALIVVDHGGPSPASAQLRNDIAAQVAAALPGETSGVRPASLEGEEYPHNQPLLENALRDLPAGTGDVVIAPLFLAPGRHAGPAGDLAQIAAAAEQENPSRHCHFTELIGTHRSAVDALAEALNQTLSTFHVAA